MLKTGRRGLPPSAAADWEVPEEKTYGSFRCLGPKLTFLFEHEQERARGPNNRLNSVTDWAGRVTAYQYDNNGRLALTSRPDGTQETRRRSRKFAYILKADEGGANCAPFALRRRIRLGEAVNSLDLRCAESTVLHIPVDLALPLPIAVLAVQVRWVGGNVLIDFRDLRAAEAVSRQICI